MVTTIEVAERNIRNNVFQSYFPAVNSPPVAHRDISTASTTDYRPFNEEYVPVQRNIERSVQPEDTVRTKKEKKWSIGKLFRRKKKEVDSSSSSESEEGVDQSPKKKSKKKKKIPAVNNFDHIVIRNTRRAQSLAKPQGLDVTDDGILSDPSAGFLSHRSKSQGLYCVSKDSLLVKDDALSRSGKSVLEVPMRKTRKGRLKARVEALRNSLKGDSSSDEESLKSSNSSTMVRFRSEDSLMRSRDSSLNKKSRSARNERYIKRLSRDEENQLNKEAELIQQGYTKAEVEMLTRTPTSQSSGYGTCRREQSNKMKLDQTYNNESNRRPMKSESVSSFPSTQSYPSSINFNAKVNNDHINYSFKYQKNNTNTDNTYANNNRERSISNQYEDPVNVMCVKFPLGNVTNVKIDEKSPPVPPPRDMQRKVVTPVSMYYENNSLVADRKIEYQNITHGIPNKDFERIMRRSQERSIKQGPNGLRRPLSNSEDHIAMQNDYMQNFIYRHEQPRRPASVSAEPNYYGLYVNTPPWRKKVGQTHTNIVKPESIQLRQDYLYYADQSPRSRRPISIQSSQNGQEKQYMSDSQTSLNTNDIIYRRPRNASEFWKKLDDAERQRKVTPYINLRSNTQNACNNQINKGRNCLNIEQGQLLNRNGMENNEHSDVHNQTKSHFYAQPRDTCDGAKMWKATTEYKRSVTVEPPSSAASPTVKSRIRHKSDTFLPNSCQIPSDDEKSSERRKSTNLDDALNELEAIYNSLGLGDEDLLDRAERRELMTPKFKETFNDWNGNDNEIQLRSQPTTPLKRISRRSTLPDKLQDDMAFRRLNSLTKEKPNYKEAQDQISYMLASPVFIPYASDDDRHSSRNEPDIVHDDVVYRNITQTNNRLKTVDPQPPFGIPVGPVSPAPQSDYLHATPENKYRSRFVPRRSPDIVSDDLAYRSLRKDNRHSSLFNGEDFNAYINNNSNVTEFPITKDSATNLKKKRAVRSLSANIFTMIQKEIDEALNMSKEATLHKTSSNSDVMRRLRDSFEKNDNEKDLYPRNKVKQRHNTVNLFVNNCHAHSHHFAKDDSFVHNDEKYLSKPPLCDKSKSSSPSNRSPQPSKRSSKDEFQQVLSMLAQEAMDTSNKLGVALAELDKNRNNSERKLDLQNKMYNSRSEFMNGLTSKPSEYPETELKLTNICSKELTESKLNNLNVLTNEQSKGKKTEDSLIEISNQLNKVEDQLKHSIEKEIHNDKKILCQLSHLKNEYQPNKNNGKEDIKHNSPLTPSKETKPDLIPITLHCDTSKHEIKNSFESGSAAQSQIIEEHRSLNPFLNTDEKLKEISEINAFKELKEGISDLIAGISQVNEKLFLPKTINHENDDLDSKKVTGIKEANEKISEVTDVKKSEVPNRTSANLSIYEDDLEVKKETADSTEYNSSEELATIFHLETNAKLDPVRDESRDNPNNKIRDDLSSPKLVQSMNQHLRRLSVDQIDDSSPSQHIPQQTNIVPWRAKRQNSNSQKENRENSPQPKRSWRESGTLMLACYTLMLSQQLADLDWLTLLGLLLAMVTIVAILLI